MKRLAALTVVLALGAAPAQARFDSPVTLDAGKAHGATSAPLAALTEDGRFAFDTGSPVRSALPSLPVGVGDFDPWPANARGDVLRVAALRDFHAIALDASGATAAITIVAPPGRINRTEAASLATDGTAALAWTEQRANSDEPTDAGIFVRIRPPGGQFGAILTVLTAAPVRSLKVLAGPNGTAEVAYAAGGRVYHADLPGAMPVALTEAGEFVNLELTPGRVVMSESGISEAVRGPGGWSVARLTESVKRDPTVIALPDGGAAIAYESGPRVQVARAAAGVPFRPPGTVARRPKRTDVTTAAFAAGPAGELLVAWIEESTLADFGRVKTAFAPAGQAFGRAETVPGFPSHPISPLVAALSPDGRRLLAWSVRSRKAREREAGLQVALGEGLPAPVQRDRRPPRVRVVVKVADLRAGLRTGRIPVRVSCDEACDVSLSTVTSKADPFTAAFVRAHVVLRRAGSARVVARVDGRDLLRLVLDLGGARYHYGAADVAGNVRAGSIALPRLVG